MLTFLHVDNFSQLIVSLKDTGTKILLALNSTPDTNFHRMGSAFVLPFLH
jgi:hypothetical protein